MNRKNTLGFITVILIAFSIAVPNILSSTHKELQNHQYSPNYSNALSIVR